MEMANTIKAECGEFINHCQLSFRLLWQNSLK